MRILCCLALLSVSISARVLEICPCDTLSWEATCNADSCAQIQVDETRMLLKDSRGFELLSDKETTLTYQPNELVTYYNTRSMTYLARFKNLFSQLLQRQVPDICQQSQGDLLDCHVTLMGDAKARLTLHKKYPSKMVTHAVQHYQIPQQMWLLRVSERSLPWTVSWPDGTEILDMRHKGEDYA